MSIEGKHKMIRTPAECYVYDTYFKGQPAQFKTSPTIGREDWCG